MVERSNVYDAENLFSGKYFATLGDEPPHTPTGSGNGGGSDMNSRMTRIETIAENQSKLISDIRNEMIAIRGDMHGLERRIIDKMDENRDKASENQKWLIGLLISSILVPLFIALVTK